MRDQGNQHISQMGRWSTGKSGGGEKPGAACRELQLSSEEEFDLLVFLAGHPKRLVTPRTRLATNWTGSALRQAEFMRVLQPLRKKLDAEGDSTQHYIQTEPWILYRFDPGPSRAL
jgi:DNA-binding winged helix-turn-helix (wHTH) protein